LPAETLSAKEAARELGTDARTFRKFMRATTSKEDQPGQGNRYAIPKTRIKKLKTAFDEWNKPKAKTPPPDVELDDEELEDSMMSEDEDFEDDDDGTPDFSASADDEEPTDDELGEIEGEEDFDLTDIEEL
jgi:hypothetical protein